MKYNKIKNIKSPKYIGKSFNVIITYGTLLKENYYEEEGECFYGVLKQEKAGYYFYLENEIEKHKKQYIDDLEKDNRVDYFILEE